MVTASTLRLAWRAMSEPGGLYISGSVFEHVNGKLPHSFVSMGPQTLKNIDRPIQIYRLAGKDGPGPAASVVELPLPDKPSIVVLPFVNMSADAEQSYFVDGLTEDLITDLSKVPELFVIARNSSFAYKGRSIDVRQIARELGVKYVLEGSARRAADRVRINAQLIDARAGGHIWADRFDRDLADIFAAQDEVIGKIVEALVGKLTAAGLSERYRPANLEAYDLCVRGRAQYEHHYRGSRRCYSAARESNRPRSQLCRSVSMARPGAKHRLAPYESRDGSLSPALHGVAKKGRRT